VTNTEILSQYMEPRPEHPPWSWQSTIRWGAGSPLGWWCAKQEPEVYGHWVSILDVCPDLEKLGRLHLIEERLTDEQWEFYHDELADAFIRLCGHATARRYTHATADQKIEALARVLGPSADEECAFVYGHTTCGYTRARHYRADGSPMDHEFTEATRG